MKFTKRDLILLKWLVLFVALYAFWSFVWTPMTNSLTTAQANLNELKLQKQMAIATLPTYDQVKADEVQVKIDIQNKFSKFFDVKSPAQIEAFLIPILTQYEARINYFLVSETTVVIPVSTVHTNEELTYKVKELIDQYKHITAQTSSVPVTQSQLLKTQMTYTLSTTFDNYLRLLNAVDQLNTSILLSSSQFDLKDGTAKLVFDVYSIEKLSF